MSVLERDYSDDQFQRRSLEPDYTHHSFQSKNLNPLQSSELRNSQDREEDSEQNYPDVEALIEENRELR